MKTNIPLVSIGCPVYNSEKTIGRTLDALLAQTYPNIEIIISDNCSADGTGDICKAYAEKDNRITLNINRTNLGINANFKIVYRMASGKYFMWAAADDYWEPEFIKTLVDELELETRAGLAMCALKRENPDGSLKDVIKFDKRYNSSVLSQWQMATKLLSPKERIQSQKYNLFIHGLFRYSALENAFQIEENILSYQERGLLFLTSLSYRFVYVDKILFSKTVQAKSFRVRHPDDPFTRGKKKLGYQKYWRKYYKKLAIDIIKSSKISLPKKILVLYFPIWMIQRIIQYKTKKRKKRMRKKLYKTVKG